MTLKIISAAKVEFSGKVELVMLPGVEGLFTILENHASLISALTAGNIEYVENGKRNTIAIAGGIVDVDNNVVSVCLY
ncbi:MAG: ATP synthase F1 subunit epsilon [Muribaculaceae bacterium]|nr:ATP synthase F1 subunit epsilon [Muribaculaceae bacterium]